MRNSPERRFGLFLKGVCRRAGWQLFYDSSSMRIGLLQLDPVVGDLPGNAAAIAAGTRSLAASGAQVVVGSELGLIGYPPRDLLLREGVVEACEDSMAQLACALPASCAVLVGSPRRASDGTIRNAVALCRNGRVEQWFDKQLLPTYDVFDEWRHFVPGTPDQTPVSFTCDGKRIGVLICEDIWRAEDSATMRRYETDPLDHVAAASCDLLAVLSAAPFVLGKRALHHARLASIATQLGIPIAAVNQVGANDDVLFEGGSLALSHSGQPLAVCASWALDSITVDTDADPIEPQKNTALEADLFDALCTGVAGYCAKTGNTKVCVGLSGGIDSALVATIAAAALGPKNVTGVLMPSRYSSNDSLVDARELAANLELGAAHEIEIESIHAAARDALAPALGDVTGVTDENLQARARGLLLMAVANATSALTLATGNKSEFAVGYCTLYGDMAGGVAVIGDVLKTQVFALARWLNDNWESTGRFTCAPIPESSITKPPSAELRPDQRDSDSLPPYDQLDAIVRLRIEDERSVASIHEQTGLPVELIRRWVDVIDRNEFKRHQAPIVLKVSPRTFGRGRPVPLALRWARSSD